jgi:hypothetical protein
MAQQPPRPPTPSAAGARSGVAARPRTWSRVDHGPPSGCACAHTTPASHKDGKRHIISFQLHVCRNLIARVPTHAQDQVKRDYWAIFDQVQAEGEAAVAEARRRAARFIARWKPLYPAAVACVADHLDALVAHLLFPAEHHKRIRHSNLIERTFGETRRRTKVIGRLPGEQSCLSLVWAVLDRASKGWRGLTMTPKGATPAAGPAARPARPATTSSTRGGDHPDQHRRVTSRRSLRPEPFTPLLRRHPFS